MKKLLTLLIFSFFFFKTSAQKTIQKFTLSMLKDSIQKVINDEKIVGLMVGITTKDSVIFSGGFGYADLENKQKVSEKTLFRMGSNTKMFVSLGILQLQKEGKININDEIKKIAPEIKFENKWEATNPLRVVHLLEHTSGFDDMKLNAMYTLEKFEKSDLLNANQASLICRWKPGERHSYGNPNYNLLGYLIEKITKNPYNQYLSEAILKPLQMNSSNFNLFSKNPNDTKEYIVRNGKVEKVPSVTLIGGPQGALWSNAEDMIKFLQMYLKSGEPIFDENIINEMETPHSGLGAKAGLKSGYALGNYYTHFYNKYGMRGHNGLVGTCFSACVYNRKLGFGYVIANNSNYGGSKIEELIHTFLEQNTPKNPQNIQILDEKAIEPYLGFYQFASSRNEVASLMDKFSIANQFYIEKEDLYMKKLFGETEKLFQNAPNIFYRKGMNIPTIAFTKTEDGKNAMMMGGTYFEQSSYVWALIWRGAMVFMIILILISGIVAICSLIGAFMKKVAWKQIPKRFLPLLALGFFGIAASKLLEKQQFSYLLYKLNDINADTLIIFCGTAFFGIAGLICFNFALQSFRENKNRFYAWYWMLTYASVFFLAIILFANGFIGIRTWAM